MRIYWRNCELAEEEHEENRRQYAHTFHYPDTICLASAFWNLPKAHRDGILLHEIGHLLAGPQGSEAAATRAAEEFYNVRIRYVDSQWGDELEKLS